VTGVDTNILVYAHRRDLQWHEPALRAVRSLAEGAEPWAIPWPCVHEFVGSVTRQRLFNPPSTLQEALEQVETWRASPSLVLLAETGDYWSHLRRLLETGQITGPRVHDARIAALCRLHGVRELWSADRDFSRFPELRVRNPLIG
jgi:toxin-antitoxin system PIN domain toxin